MSPLYAASLKMNDVKDKQNASKTDEWRKVRQVGKGTLLCQLDTGAYASVINTMQLKQVAPNYKIKQTKKPWCGMANTESFQWCYPSCKIQGQVVKCEPLVHRQETETIIVRKSLATLQLDLESAQDKCRCRHERATGPVPGSTKCIRMEFFRETIPQRLTYGNACGTWSLKTTSCTPSQDCGEAGHNRKYKETYFQYTAIQRVHSREDHCDADWPQTLRDNTPQAYNSSTIEIAGHDSESERMWP